ncbi:MAG: hypothetical protein AB7S38_14365 [Vulcanimicrobiota bacterium]
MEVIHLPPGMVGYLNCLWWGESDQTEQQEEFRALWQATRAWFEFNSAYCLDEGESRDFENFEVVWQEVIAELDQREPSLERLVPPLYQAIRLMNQINRHRQTPHFSSLAAVNEVLMAGAALASGRGQPRALAERLPLAQEYLGNLKAMLAARRERIPAEALAELEKGFGWCDQALKSLTAARVKEGLELLKAGASLVEFLVDWDIQAQQQFRQRYSRFNIPLIGPDLELGLESARDGERRRWARGVRHTLNDLVPRLEEFWEMTGNCLLLPADSRVELVTEASVMIEELKAALANLTDQEVAAEEALAGYEQALEACSEVFTAVQAAALRGEHLRGSLAGTYHELLRGVLAGSVPDAAVAELLDTAPPEPGWKVAPHLEAYLEGGPEECLLEAATALHQANPKPETANQPSWRECVYCGHQNPLQEAFCQSCQGLLVSLAQLA